MPEIEKKIRIQLYDTEFNQVSDRLLSQKTVFYKGPEEVHKGPLKVEVCLFSKEDIDDFKAYLDKLRGDIPIETEKGIRGRKRKFKETVSLREGLVEVLNSTSSMKEWIDTLREQGFQFTSLDLLEDLGYPIQISAVARKKQKFMVRLIKKAKNPLHDKYDPSLLVGFRDKEVWAYSGDEILGNKVMDIPLGNKVVIPAKAKVRFPDYLNQDERNRFRAQMELLKRLPEKQPSTFYKRWLGEVVKNSPPEIDFPRAEQVPDPFNPGQTVQDFINNRRGGKASN